MSKYQNIADYILQASGYTSCSDVEDQALGVVENQEDENRVRVSLSECGPRMNMSIVKIQEGFMRGNVIFHSISSCLIKFIKIKRK